MRWATLAARIQPPGRAVNEMYFSRSLRRLREVRLREREELALVVHLCGAGAEKLRGRDFVGIDDPDTQACFRPVCNCRRNLSRVLEHEWPV